MIVSTLYGEGDESREPGRTHVVSEDDAQERNVADSKTTAQAHHVLDSIERVVGGSEECYTLARLERWNHAGLTEGCNAGSNIAQR